MRYASIDIGTNTILMLIGETDGAASVKPVKDFYSVPRIGKSVSSTKILDSDSISRALEVLVKYRTIADDFRVDRIVASATSAVRDAVNRDEFISKVKESCGIDVEVIGGDVEARLAFLGAISGEADKSKSSLVIDIGGGSTEFSHGTGTEPAIFKSINIGAIRVTEKFFKRNPPTDDELGEATRFIEDALKAFPFSDAEADRVFAVAGTATTIALISQNRYKFDAAAVNNHYMSAAALDEVFNRIRTKTPAEILELTEAAEGRSDVILAGALILRKALEAARAAGFLSTDRGLRYGFLLYKYLQYEGR